jgi:hypothetical protein
MSSSPIRFAQARAELHQSLLASILTRSSNSVLSNANDENPVSNEIASQVAARIGQIEERPKLDDESTSLQFVNACRRFVHNTFMSLAHLRPGAWGLLGADQKNERHLSQFEQYSHLSSLTDAMHSDPELAALLGNENLLMPDIVLYRQPETDDSINKHGTLIATATATRSPLRKSSGSSALIHASISCKWTLRSDRAQNARSEALNLIRNRKGRVPHIVSITAEPLPSRIASLALGTSDLDCVYHFALPELLEVVTPEAFPDANDMLKTLVDGKRLRDIADLPLDLCV